VHGWPQDPHALRYGSCCTPRRPTSIDELIACAGRKDAQGPEDCPKEGNLPGANLPGKQTGPFGDGTVAPADHLRKVSLHRPCNGWSRFGRNCPLLAWTEPWCPDARQVFHRMGLSDKDIVALSGAHTLGRAYKVPSLDPSETAELAPRACSH
jgi:hypothetical protein